MDDYRVNVSGIAKDDIKSIYAYLDGVLCNRALAVKTYKEIKQAVLSLATMPKRRPLVGDPDFAAKGVRSLQVERYLVFYVVDEMPGAVSVLRVLHERREWKALLERRDAGPEG